MRVMDQGLNWRNLLRQFLGSSSACRRRLKEKKPNFIEEYDTTYHERDHNKKNQTITVSIRAGHGPKGALL